MKAHHTNVRSSETNQGCVSPVFSTAGVAAAELVSVSTLSTSEGKTCREASAKYTGRAQ